MPLSFESAEAHGSAGAAPALRRGLAVLRLLAERPAPLSAGAIARDLGLPRSTTYELLTELAAAGFAVHLPAQRRWGLGVGAFEIGTAYLRSEPLERLGRPVLARLAATTGSTVHLGILHGPETLYLVKERPPGSAVSLVTEVGVRLPAALTATGLSILADLSAGQVRALFPRADAFVDRTGRGPRTLPELRTLLAQVRRRRWAFEDGQVTAGAASVAAAVFDHNAMPIAAIGITVAHRCPEPAARSADCTFDELVPPVRQAVATLTAAIGGRGPTVGLIPIRPVVLMRRVVPPVAGETRGRPSAPDGGAGQPGRGAPVSPFGCAGQLCGWAPTAEAASSMSRASAKSRSVRPPAE